jgi:hypothetical protein
MTSDRKEVAGAVSPKLFVSYSWTSPDHEAWVVRLASDLRESGIDVILDKWDLKEGHDAHAFMEKMVTDPEIKKVILICDKAYAQKTDGRTGGAGAEAQIISGKIYEKLAQDKFVAVLKERDERGTAYLPAYYRSRIYIDLSDSSTFSENFEKLLRWAYDQPLYEKPTLGPKPLFLSNEKESVVLLATSSRQKRALDALRDNRSFAIPAAAEYFKLLSQEFEKLRIDSNVVPFDEAVVQSIGAFLPYRNEAITIFATIATHLDMIESRTLLHRFFEEIIPYMDRPAGVNQFREMDWDNFKFIAHELFLYAIAILIRHERFESAAYLMNNRYYVADQSRGSDNVMDSFDVIRKFMQSLVTRNERMKLGRLSVRADLLRERSLGVGIEFRHLMQADFVLFLRSRLTSRNRFTMWFPETLLYSHSGPFEVFARSISRRYFDRAKILLGIDRKEELEVLLKNLSESPQTFPHWQFESFQPGYLLGIEKLATEP